MKAVLHYFIILVTCGDCQFVFDIAHDRRLTTKERSLFWHSWALLGWQSVSVTSAALHLVLIASELITPASVKQCCQTSPAQPRFHSIPCTPTGQMEASEELECCFGKKSYAGYRAPTPIWWLGRLTQARSVLMVTICNYLW